MLYVVIDLKYKGDTGSQTNVIDGMTNGRLPDHQ